MKKHIFKFSLLLTIFLFISQLLFSQIEIAPWGNIKGIRIDGQLMEFESNLSVVQNDWSHIIATAKERQRPKYARNGKEQIVTTNIDSLYITEVVTDAGKGSATVKVQGIAKADMPVDGIYFSLVLPGEYYANGRIRLDHLRPVMLTEDAATLEKYLLVPAGTVQFMSASRQLTITFEKPTNIIIKNLSLIHI